MVKRNYKSPRIETFSFSDLSEIIGPGCAASGQLNMDMYRGSAMLEKVYEYRLAKNADLGIKNLNDIGKIQEVKYV